jgi:glycosyltransferase involved in cell wall biosynthesis
MSDEVVHVTTSLSEADGVSVAVLRTCEALDRLGVDVALATLEATQASAQLPFLRTFPASRFLAPIGYAPALEGWLHAKARAEGPLILHGHSLWRMPNVYVGRVARKTAARLVVSPHGALAGWALKRRRYRKEIFRALLQGPALQAAACFHATSEAEYEDIRRAGFAQPICILRHGVDLPTLERAPGARKRLLFLGRVNSRKGVNVLLEAWRAVESEFLDWDLEIVGPGDEEGGLEDFAARIGIRRVSFRGPLCGAQKDQAFQEAGLFVLPSPSENFGLAIAESLAAGIPVIVTRGTPWREVETRKAGWWIDCGVPSLESALRDALSRPPLELQAMGQAGRAWMASDFSWEDVARQWQETYRWLARPDRVPRPSWVRVD